MTDIEIEFNRHKVPSDIQKKIVNDTCLALNIGDIAKTYFREEKRIKHVLMKQKVIQKILNASGKIGIESSEYDEYFKSDDRLLGELIDHISTHEDYLLVILEELNENNWQRMMKILDFCVLHYASNYNYIQGMRRSLEYTLNGIDYYDNRNEDTREEFKEWFYSVMEQEKTAKKLEKK